MNCQSIGRNQRPRGLKLKQALKLALLLAVGAWLVYQIKHSLHESKGYGETVNIKLDKDPAGSVALGRKGIIDGSLSSSDKVDSAVGTATKKSLHDEIENVRYNNDIGVQEKDNASSLIEELPREDYTGKGQDYLKASKSDHDDEMEQEPMKMPGNGTDSDQQALLDGVDGFHDENGVPEPGNNNLISMLIGNNHDSQGNVLLQEGIVTSDNQSTTLAEDGNVNTSSSMGHVLEATKEEH